MKIKEKHNYIFGAIPKATFFSLQVWWFVKKKIKNVVEIVCFLWFPKFKRPRFNPFFFFYARISFFCKKRPPLTKKLFKSLITVLKSLGEPSSQFLEGLLSPFFFFFSLVLDVWVSSIDKCFFNLLMLAVRIFFLRGFTVVSQKLLLDSLFRFFFLWKEIQLFLKNKFFFCFWKNKCNSSNRNNP